MKKKVNKLEELKKNPKFKAILFFSFYFIFFLIIILSLRFGDRHQIISSDYEKGHSENYKLDVFMKDDFVFVYVINVDGVKYEYYGVKDNNLEYFVFNDNKYYSENGKFFVKNNNEWVECDNPIVFNAFLNRNNIISLLESSFYDSKTTYNSGKTNFNYLLSTNTINNIIFNNNTDIDDESNQVVLVSDDNNVINDINFNLDNYCESSSLCNNNLKIQIQFEENSSSTPRELINSN